MATGDSEDEMKKPMRTTGKAVDAGSVECALDMQRTLRRHLGRYQGGGLKGLIDRG